MNRRRALAGCKGGPLPRLAGVGLVLVAVVAAACGSSSGDRGSGPSTTETTSFAPVAGEPSQDPYIAVTLDDVDPPQFPGPAPGLVHLTISDWAAYEALRSTYDDPWMLADALTNGGLELEGVLVEGGLGLRVGSDCTRSASVFLTRESVEFLRVSPGFCGARSRAFISIGASTVTTGRDWAPAWAGVEGPAVEGAAVLDGPGLHDLGSGEVAGLVLDSDAVVAPTVCLDVVVPTVAPEQELTVSTAEGGAVDLLAGWVPVRVEVLDGAGAPVELHDPPEFRQPPTSVMLYPLPPISLQVDAPASVRVSADVGVIDRWELNARTC